MDEELAKEKEKMAEEFAKKLAELVKEKDKLEEELAKRIAENKKKAEELAEKEEKLRKWEADLLAREKSQAEKGKNFCSE